VQVADACERISLAAGVSLDLFEEINPSIDANCFNLITGLWYCVHPTIDWNMTSPSNGTTQRHDHVINHDSSPGTDASRDDRKLLCLARRRVGRHVLALGANPRRRHGPACPPES
jgi:hypothetical protein